MYGVHLSIFSNPFLVYCRDSSVNHYVLGTPILTNVFPVVEDPTPIYSPLPSSTGRLTSQGRQCHLHGILEESNIRPRICHRNKKELDCTS